MPARNDSGAVMAPLANRIRWAGLAGRAHGASAAARPSFVLLHGLTFDRRMWDPLLAALPDGDHAIAFDLPGHGGSPPLNERGLRPVAAAIRDAVDAAGITSPIVVGHSIGGPLATIYAAANPAAAVVSIDAPIRVEPFATTLAALRPQLSGDGFADVWERFRAGFGLDRLTPAQRRLLAAGDHAARDVVLAYQSDLLDGSPDEVVAWRDRGLAALRAQGTPYVSLHTRPVGDDDRAWLAERLPQADVVVWPVGHHFPQVTQPERLASLLADLATVG